MSKIQDTLISILNQLILNWKTTGRSCHLFTAAGVKRSTRETDAHAIDVSINNLTTVISE
ncbi:Hypothetical predicted protein [Podarcis lilfordi]|uniref:Uncharacterized protein n=1 Tax=Podarcis lilfordi TaxID=74358 RepID=A0AA35K5Q2_9SAUR|nr:Hypothetical predicted protein [Podarcis lilfordi]